MTSETPRTAAWKQSSLQRWRIVHLCYTQYNSVIQIHKGAFYNLFFHHLLMQHKANLSTQVSLKHLLDYQLTFKRNYFYSWENNSFHFPKKFWSQIIKGLQHIWEKLLSWLHHRWKNDERAMVTIDTLTHGVCSNSRPEPYVFYASSKFPELLLNPDVASQIQESVHSRQMMLKEKASNTSVSMQV